MSLATQCSWNCSFKMVAYWILLFKQDGAPTQFAHIVRDYLNRSFPGRWIGRGSPRLWASRSPDLIPLDFLFLPFLWRYRQLSARCLAPEEQVAIVSTRVRGLSYEDARVEFTHKFRKPAPTRAHFRLLVNKFKRTGSVCVMRHAYRQKQCSRFKLPVIEVRRLSRELMSLATQCSWNRSFKMMAYWIQLCFSKIVRHHSLHILSMIT